MIEAELGKEIKKAPVVEYEIPKRIFKKYEPESGMEDSLLVKIIDFS
jgi:U3 small nucleolar RNA-associated protein 19